MAAVERNVYDEKTMSILVTGEEGTDEAETFLQDKLCEQERYARRGRPLSTRETSIRTRASSFSSAPRAPRAPTSPRASAF
jgi:hypothetical protein